MEYSRPVATPAPPWLLPILPRAFTRSLGPQDTTGQDKWAGTLPHPVAPGKQEAGVTAPPVDISSRLQPCTAGGCQNKTERLSCRRTGRWLPQVRCRPRKSLRQRIQAKSNSRAEAASGNSCPNESGVTKIRRRQKWKES